MLCGTGDVVGISSGRMIYGAVCSVLRRRICTLPRNDCISCIDSVFCRCYWSGTGSCRRYRTSGCSVVAVCIVLSGTLARCARFNVYCMISSLSCASLRVDTYGWISCLSCVRCYTMICIIIGCRFGCFLRCNLCEFVLCG